MMTFVYVALGFVAGVLCTVAVNMKGEDVYEGD